MPDFLLIGAGKSGTTALHNYLNQHPEIFMCPLKETNFFELEGQEINSDPKKDPEMLFHYPQSINNLEDFQALFEDAEENNKLGETSPMYLYGEKSPESIKRQIPNAKLIAILREPTSRLFSRYLHLARDGHLPTENFTDALDPSTIWWRRNDLVKEGFYHKHISRYFELFDRSQIKVFLYDDLRKNPHQVISEMFEFIGVDSSFEPSMEVEYNVSGKPKNPIVDALIGSNSIIIRTAKAIMPGIIEKIKSSESAQKQLTELRKKNLDRDGLTDELKDRFYNEIYKNDILQLEKLLGRDLSSWKRD